MTHRRLNNSLIAIISALFCVLVLSHAARAESDLSWHVAGYAVFKASPGTGYDPGFGGTGELYGRWKFLELKLDGTIRNQHKKNAQEGYTFGYGIEGRGYVHGPWYVLGASSWAGYKSEFESGAIWEKKGQNYGIGAGYNNGDTDVTLAYYFKEHESPNHVQYTTIALRQRIWKYLHGLCNISRTTYDQMTSTEMERWSGWGVTIGLGVKF